jgi:glycosyltransferase involved in cell wall biosynthesis
MKISFVIPAYNEEAYIGECLESIFREAKGKKYDLEIIVVDNASDDSTAKIAKSFKGVKVVYEPKKGLVSARKAGYLASKGDLIANVDSDSRLTKGWIDKVLEEFKDAKLAGLSGPFIYYDLSDYHKFLVKLFYVYAFSLYVVNRYILNGGSMLQGGNFVVRRTALDKIGGFDDKHFSFYGEDADIAKRLHSAGPVKWTFSLPIYSSGRRMAAEGPFTMCTRYTINYLWVMLFKRPFTNKVLDIRFKGIKNKYLNIHPKDLRKEWFSTLFVIMILCFLPLVIIVMFFYLLQNIGKAIAD